MAACLDVEAWRISTPEEMLAFLGDGETRGDKRKRHLLSVRTRLRPVDVYTYLKARFGEPNGIQTFLRRDDSDNLVHWDFFLWAAKDVVYLSGSSREILIMVTEDLSDEQWKELINNIKGDFVRVASEKSTILRSFEKYVVFQNKFAALAALCGDLHADITDLLPSAPAIPTRNDDNDDDVAAINEAWSQQSKRIQQLFGDCLKLRLLMPIMAEAYINMLILTFCRSAIRDDAELYNAFVRAKIPERLKLLRTHCDGFSRDVDHSLPGWEDFMRIVNRRNFELHGNVDPIRDQIETVYFEGRRPIFVNSGHNILVLFEQMEKQANPEGLLEEYIGLHAFLHEIAGCLTPRHQAFFEQVISDAHPGYEVHKRRPTRLFPDHLAWHGGQGARYDDDLKVQW